MSRTKRYIPHWNRNKNSCLALWDGIVEDHNWRVDGPVSEKRRLEALKNRPDIQIEINQDRWYNGYDKHHATSRVRDGYFKRNNWNECVTGKKRKVWKRYFHKQFRKIMQKHISEHMED